MKTFKQFQEGIFDFLPKGKTLNRGTGGSLTNQEKQRYKMPIQKQPTGGSKMPVLPGKFPKSDKYKVTGV
tara:strand:+ start:60 stop:269 length:210 start_codon:yes stop_codon:yes gene_type:complete